MRRVLSVLILLFVIDVSSSVAAAESVPFVLCNESATWIRPPLEVQARIWNDARYHDIGPRAWEWSHNFLWVGTESASIQYHTENMAGLWTEGVFSPGCNSDKKETEWIGVWVLLNRVKSIEIADSTYTIHVEPSLRGFQSILIKRLNPNATLRFVDDKGQLLDEIVEGVTPGTPLPR